MKFLIIAASLVVLTLVVSCGVEETAEIPTAPFQTTFAAASAESQLSGREILIDFYTDW